MRPRPRTARRVDCPAARMRCAGFSGQPGEAFDVVAFVRVDDPLDSGHLPGRLDRRVVEWTTSHPPIAPVWTIEQCEQPLAWCRVGCLGHLVGLAGGLPEPAQVLLHQRGLTRKVLVESPLGYRSLVRNQFDPGGVDALAVEQLCSRLQDTLTSAAAPAPGGFRCSGDRRHSTEYTDLFTTPLSACTVKAQSTPIGLL